jgi:predicted transcriptional regulator
MKMIKSNDSRLAPKFVVRLPEGLREEVDAAARAADTSMNTIFVRAVRQYLDGQRRQELLLNALANAAARSEIHDAA